MRMHITAIHIEYINKNSQIDPDEMADFLVVAARLLLIKSKALLPFIYPPEEEKEMLYWLVMGLCQGGSVMDQT